jgi:hypothetical protein
MGLGEFEHAADWMSVGRDSHRAKSGYGHLKVTATGLTREASSYGKMGVRRTIAPEAGMEIFSMARFHVRMGQEGLFAEALLEQLPEFTPWERIR